MAEVEFVAGSGPRHLDAAIVEALELRRFADGATATELSVETGAPVPDVEAALERLRGRARVTAAA